MSKHITIEALIEEARLDAAFGWLCQRRRDWSANDEVWAFRRRWPQEKARLRQALRNGTYEGGLLSRVTLWRGGQPESVDLWPARDALVMKALAGLLHEHLPISSRCAHLAGHGGQKASVRQAWDALPHNQFVLKTGVKPYYASIDHHRLLDRLTSTAWQK